MTCERISTNFELKQINFLLFHFIQLLLQKEKEKGNLKKDDALSSLGTCLI